MRSIRNVAAVSYLWLIAVSFAIAQDTKLQQTQNAPKINIKRGDASNGLQECPDKNYKLKVNGSTAQLYETATGKPLGRRLFHEPSTEEFLPPSHKIGEPFIITCWAFSPDGKFVAMGAGNKNSELDEGEVCVWAVPDGKLIRKLRDKNRKTGLGSVRSLAFSNDNSTVYFDARPFSIDGL